MDNKLLIITCKKKTAIIVKTEKIGYIYYELLSLNTLFNPHKSIKWQLLQALPMKWLRDSLVQKTKNTN